MAYLLTQQGHQVDVFEKGPAYAYPHSQQWQEVSVHLNMDADFFLPGDLQNHTNNGLHFHLEDERRMRTGGSSTIWEAITVRMIPSDFKTRTLYGVGDDWPIDYDELEPYYGRAEQLMSVSGTDDDNPFSPPRSTPYPLPPFELSYDDRIMAERLREADIILHTTPQARTRQDHNGRPACNNFGTCRFCPIGARYSPNFHLEQAVATGLCELHTEISVRRVYPDDNGPGATIVYQENHSSNAREAHYDVVIIAAGALESARLLLLSQNEQHPDGVGNSGGRVGQGLTFHHMWTGHMLYEDELYPFRFGGWTGQSFQFLDPETRGQHGAIKVEFSSRATFLPAYNWGTVRDPYQAMKPQIHRRDISLMSETHASPEKYLMLSENSDRFGDPYAHVHYVFDSFDWETYGYAESIFDQFKTATRSTHSQLHPAEIWFTASHHMGTCRMGTAPDNSVVDRFCQVHGTNGLFVIGGSSFVGSGGAVNPTLTMVALAIRSTDYIVDQLL
jgi:glucose dehydrogenase